MAQTTYQVTISTGGKVAVTVSTDDPAEMKAALAWAELSYKHLASRGQRDDQPKVQEQQGEKAPICAVRHVPIVRQKRDYGCFSSCHERKEDGSFCSFKPEGK